MKLYYLGSLCSSSAVEYLLLENESDISARHDAGWMCANRLSGLFSGKLLLGKTQNVTSRYNMFGYHLGTENDTKYRIPTRLPRPVLPDWFLALCEANICFLSSPLLLW